MYLKKTFNIFIFCVFAISLIAQDNCINHWETIIHPDDTWCYVSDSTFQILNESLNSSDLSAGFDLPLLLIETNGENINRDAKITADMKIMDKGYRLLNYPTDSANVYAGKIGIKIRGSSSSGFPQKSYTIETRDSIGENRNIPLLGMPKENDWLLITNYYDRSFVRNYLSHEIFRGMKHYSPRVRHCEVMLNGEYMGIYLLMESIKVDKDRLDLAKLRSEENYGDDVTGGYIIKNDNYRTDGKDNWKVQFPALEIKNWEAVQARFVYVYPDCDVITDQQKDYIQSYIETSKNVLYGSDFRNLVSGYYAYFDVLSFIDYFIISEVSRNGDAYKKSRFFHKDKQSKGGQLHAGPPWDFDWAWKHLHFQPKDGSGWVHEYEAYGYGDVQPVRLMNRMLQDEYFANELHNRYFNLRKTVLNHDILSHKIDSIANYLSNAQTRHFDKWDILNGNSNDPDSYESETFEEEITYLKGWIFDRLAWLDEHMDELLHEDNFVYSTHQMPSLALRIFPNPASDRIFIESNETINKIKLMTTDGRKVITDDLVGDNSYTLNLQSLAPGMYLVNITIQNKVLLRKIIKR